jgi:pimeloyl-ACP methyl ester carboxylesterase
MAVPLGPEQIGLPNYEPDRRPQLCAATKPALPPAAGVDDRRRQNSFRDEQAKEERMQRRPRGWLALGAILSAALVTSAVGIRAWAADPSAAFSQHAVAEVSFLEAGERDRPAVVLLHPVNGAMWTGQMAALTKAGFHVIAVDFPALDLHGSPVGFPRRAARLQTMMATLGISRFHLVGTSGGAVLAAQYAIAHPGQVRSLTVANSLAGLRDEAFNRIEARLRSPQFDAMPRDWRELGPTYRALDPNGAARWFEMTSPPPVAPAPAATRANGSASAAVPVTWEALDHLRVPTEIITGDADPYTPPGILRLFVQRMKGSQGVVIPDSGHSAYWENPKPFNRALIAFLKRH